MRSTNEAISYCAELARAGAFIGVGMCMKNVRTAYGIPAAGDVDRDGDADAVDGMRTATVRRTAGIAHRRRGGFVWWSGGRNGYGHVAIPTGDGQCWSPGSPDAPGHWHKLPIDDVTRRWGLKLEGWSPNFNGVTVWAPPPPATPNLDAALDALERAERANRRRPRILSPMSEARKALERARALIRRRP